jgi:hypothetical protein
MPVSENSVAVVDSPATISPLLTPRDSTTHDISVLMTPRDASNCDINLLALQKPDNSDNAIQSQDSVVDESSLHAATVQNTTADALDACAESKDVLACDQVDVHLIPVAEDSASHHVFFQMSHVESAVCGDTETMDSSRVLTASSVDIPLSATSAEAISCISKNLQQVIHSPASSFHSERSDQSSDLLKSQSLTLSGGITSEELTTDDQVHVLFISV